jgi:arylsulfatase A-like enzyme
VTAVNAVTTDMLPTICELVGQPLPDRPIDGVSLKGLIDGEMTQRPSPICFWSFKPSGETEIAPRPYIDAKLQEGTTPLVKKMAGRLTRTFRNFHHTTISEHDFAGPRAILGNRYKFVISSESGDQQVKELFDLRNDQAEQNNLIETKPGIAKKLELELHSWQQSVLDSLTGADYAKP